MQAVVESCRTLKLKEIAGERLFGYGMPGTRKRGVGKSI